MEKHVLCLPDAGIKSQHTEGFSGVERSGRNYWEPFDICYEPHRSFIEAAVLVSFASFPALYLDQARTP